MKNLLKLQALVVIMITALFASCSSDENLEALENGAESAAKEYVYNMQFDAPAPAFDGLSSRATSWANNSVVYLKFKNGSSYVYGKATYSTSTSSWTIVSNSSIPATSTETQVSAYYIENPESTSSTEVRLSPTSVSYSGSGTYTSSSSTIYVKVTMTPAIGRLRFKGTSGTSIIVKPSDSHLCTYASFGISDCSFRDAKNDLTMSVKSTGYTDYVYGYFEYVSGTTNRTLTVTTDATYQRKDISSSAMADGQSACLTVPTKSNYQSLGWTLVGGNTGTIDKNAYVSMNQLVTFVDGCAFDCNVGSTAKTVKMFLSKNNYTDDDALAQFDSYSTKNAEEYKTYITGYWDNEGESWFSPNTTYYWYSVAYNATGNRGPLQKVAVKTNSETLPKAELSGLTKSGSSWKAKVSMKNGATKYYYSAQTNATEDKHFRAFEIYGAIKEGKIENYIDASTSLSFSSTSSTLSVLTYAVNSSGTIGNFSYVNSSGDSYAKTNTSIKKSSNNTSSEYNEEKYQTCKSQKSFDIHPFICE